MPGNNLVNSVIRALNVMELVGSSPSGTTVRALCSVLNLKKPTVHNLLRTLAARHYLIKTRKPIRYHLGPAVQTLRRMESDRDLIHAARPLLVSLCRQHRADVCLLEYVGSEIVAIMGARTADDGVLEFYNNWQGKPYGTGLIFQAFWPERLRHEYRARHPLTPASTALWTSMAEVDQFLVQIRTCGYLTLDAEAKRPDQATFRVAVPIFESGEITAALALMKPANEVTPEFRLRCTEKMARAARQLTQTLAADGNGAIKHGAMHTAQQRDTGRNF